MYTVVIPTGSITNLAACLAALDERRVIAIREKPFCFAKACNAGIRAAQGDDVVLLNDDATLTNPRGLLELEKLSHDHPEFGIISATIDGACIHTQQHPRPGPLFWQATFPTLAFICVYIPRTTFDTLGYLDERFIGYGWEDDDFCRRNRNAGLKQAVCGTCTAKHHDLPSCYRSTKATEWQALERLNRQLFIQKWAIRPGADPRAG